MGQITVGVATYGSGSGSGRGSEGGRGGEEGEREVGGAGDGGAGDGGAGDGVAGDGVAGDGGGEIDLLDPTVRSAAQMAPVVFRLHSEGAAESGTRGRSLEELLPALVRRIAWGGDRHKGSVRLELGAGAFAGTTVVVHAEGGRVRVELGGTEGPDLDRLRARLDARLRGHGLDVESVT